MVLSDKKWRSREKYCPFFNNLSTTTKSVSVNSNIFWKGTNIRTYYNT